MKQPDAISPYYPIFLDIHGKKCLVLGGGEVALRKVKALLKHGANVAVVSPTLCTELNRLAEDGTIQIFQRSYKAEDLQDATIAVAATDNAKINESAADQARLQGILVNSVDDLQHSDFIVPSYFCRGDFTVAVSTSGKSPALARKIRSELEKDFGSEYAQLVLLANEVRSELKQQGITVDGEAWQEALDLTLLTKLLRDSRNQEAKDIMFNNLKALGQRKEKI